MHDVGRALRRPNLEQRRRLDLPPVHLGDRRLLGRQDRQRLAVLIRILAGIDDRPFRHEAPSDFVASSSHAGYAPSAVRVEPVSGIPDDTDGVANGPQVVVADRCSGLAKLCGAKGIRTPALLDAIESTWTFATLGRVGYDRKVQVTASGSLTTEDCRRNHCGQRYTRRAPAGWPNGPSCLDVERRLV